MSVSLSILDWLEKVWSLATKRLRMLYSAISSPVPRVWVLMGLDVWFIDGGESWATFRNGKMCMPLKSMCIWDSFRTRLELTGQFIYEIFTEHVLCFQYRSITSCFLPLFTDGTRQKAEGVCRWQSLKLGENPGRPLVSFFQCKSSLGFQETYKCGHTFLTYKCVHTVLRLELKKENKTSLSV